MHKYGMFDKMLEGVQVVDRDMNYLYLNDAVAKQCMSTVEDLMFENMLKKFPTIKDSLLYSKIEECMRTGESREMQNKFIHNDGTFGWFDLRIAPVDDGVIIFSFDVTPQKLLEEEIEKLNYQLNEETQEKVSELEKSFQKQKDLTDYKTKFVSIASHQFRTPLTSIILSVALVEKYGADLLGKEKLVSHFSRIKSSADYMVSILNDFLSYEATETQKLIYKPCTLDFNNFAQSIIDSLEPLLKWGQKIQLMVKPIPCNVYIDRELTRGILLNLLSNAIKYSSENSLVVLKAELTLDCFKFDVIDNGIGIPKEEQMNLFKRFFRASNAKSIQGTGLGLNIVKQFLEEVGGKISFESELGKGSSFFVRFPCSNHEIAMS